MSFRTLLALVLLGIFVFSTVIIAVSLGFLYEQIVAILPEDLLFTFDVAFRKILLLQGGILLVASVALLTVAYGALGNLVARPLRALAAAMDAYGKTGEAPALDERMLMPSEVQSLHAAFAAFVDRVQDAHKRDTDISRMKSDFISTAAHQLRTPLTGIRWALEALEQEPLTEAQKALVVSAVGKSKDLVGIVGTLLDISSIESGKYHYRFAPVDMRELASEIARDFTSLATSRNISLFFAGSEEDDAIPPARADRERVKWVINNLVENAIRYTPSGGSVQVSVDAGGGRIFTKVRDTGIGIPQSDQANIFERFYRAGNAIQKENGGNGLGLYIARTIATDHGGDLGFAPNEGGVGTTFTLSLPSV